MQLKRTLLQPQPVYTLLDSFGITQTGFDTDSSSDGQIGNLGEILIGLGKPGLLKGSLYIGLTKFGGLFDLQGSPIIPNGLESDFNCTMFVGIAFEKVEFWRMSDV